MTRLDRLARSTRDLLDIVHRIETKGGKLRSLADAWADTTTPTGRLILTVLGGLAEFERSLIRERTAEGRARAKKRASIWGDQASCRSINGTSARDAPKGPEQRRHCPAVWRSPLYDLANEMSKCYLALAGGLLFGDRAAANKVPSPLLLIGKLPEGFFDLVRAMTDVS